MPQVEVDVEDVRRELSSVISETQEGPKVVTEAGTAEQELDLRPVYAFEEDILDTLVSARSGISLTSGRVSIKGRWIHGWLEALGEDYISSVWRGYQFFTRYLQVKTSPIQNVATVNRNPGSYESTYRYILLLEDLELIERFATEQVPQSEYDNFVPPNIRQRTFIRNTESYEGNERLWDNPFKQAYPDGEDVDVDEDSGGMSDEISDLSPDDTEETSEESESVDISIDEQTPEEDEGELPDKDLSVTDLPDPTQVRELAQSQFPQAMEDTFAQSPFPIEQVEPEDFSLGRVAAFGLWATGDAVKDQTAMQLVVSIDASEAQTNPGFIAAGVGDSLGPLMRQNNTLEGIVPNYVVVATYNSAFRSTASDQAVQQGSNQYYSFATGEFVDI